MFLLILVSLLLPILIFTRWVVKKIGGVLGDAFGAAEQISESTILLLFLLTLSINGHLPWLI
jgi:cobalamin synthase